VSFDWRGYLDIARMLAENPREEAKRAAISRAYYAAFGHVKAYLVAVGATKSVEPGHDEVWNTFKSVSGHRDCQRVTTTGFNLKDLRDRADYDAIFPPHRPLDARTRAALRWAQEVIEAVERIAQAPWPGAIPPPETDAEQLRRLIRNLSPEHIRTLLAHAKRLQRRAERRPRT
jgi:uncharacterized protein (UPF0332 family)